jgi:tetratricopeptide (TPR) repeat protein
MKPAENIKKLIKKLNVTPDSENHNKTLNDALAALEKTKHKTPAPAGANIWRIIMKSKITKLTAAMAAIIIIGFTISLINYSVTPDYAIEQTIEAMRSINSIHAYCTDWDGSKGELWVQINPETGREEYHCYDIGNILSVATPDVTYYYYKDENLVKIREGYSTTSDVRISHLFEDLVAWVELYDGKLDIHSQFNEDFQKKVVIVNISIPAQKGIGEKEIVILIDPLTKLPINLEAIKSAPGQGVKSVERFEYNMTIPEGMFEYDIPEGAKIVYMKDQECAQKIFEKAKTALAGGEYSKSIELFKEVFQLEGTRRNWAWFWLGQAYYKLGEYDSAIEAYTKVIEMFSKHNFTPHYSHLARGLALRAKGEENAAWEDFIIALPVMIDSLRNIQGAEKFDYADDPIEKGKNLTEQQRFNKMIARLKEIAGESIDVYTDLTKEEIISAWEKWWDSLSTE